MADLGFAWGAVKRAVRGEVIPSSTMAAIRRRGGEAVPTGTRPPTRPLPPGEEALRGTAFEDSVGNLVRQGEGTPGRYIVTSEGQVVSEAGQRVARLEWALEQGLITGDIKGIQRVAGALETYEKTGLVPAAAGTKATGTPALAGVADRLEAAMSITGTTFDREVLRFSDVIWDAVKTTPRQLKQRIAELRGQAIDAAHPVRAGEIDDALRSFNGDATATARILQQMYRNTQRGRLGRLKVLQKELGDKITELRPAWYKARGIRADRLNAVSRPLLGRHEGQIMLPGGRGVHPMWQNQVYPEEIAVRMTKLLNDEASAWLKVAAIISSTLRLPIAAIDLSFGGIQLMLAHLDPLTVKAAIKADLLGAAAFINPRVFDRYIAREVASMNQRIFYAGAQRPFEFFESMGYLSKMAGKIPGGKLVVGQTYGRGQAAFSMASTVYKNEMWKATSARWIKKGQGAAYARFLDRQSGMMSFNQLGMPANLQAFAAGWVSFAPQYTMSVVSLVAEIFKGGMTGAAARGHISRAIGAGVVYYVTLMNLLDKPIYLNPITDGKKFMSAEINGRWIGLGSKIVGLMRLSTDIAASAFSVGENEPMDFLTLDRWKNPVFRGWFVQSAVLPSLIRDVATQTDFQGYPLETPEEWASWALEHVTPIFAQDTLFDKSGVPVTKLAIGADFFGWRTSSESRWERLNDRILHLKGIDVVSGLSDEQRKAIEDGDTVLSTLNRVQKIELFEAFPELEPLYQASAADALLRASETFKNYQQSIVSIRETATDGLKGSLLDVQEKGENTKWLRDRYNNIMATYGDQNTIIHDVEEYQPIFEEWEENKEKRIEDAHVIDRAYWAYIEQVASGDYQLRNGDFDFDAYKNSLQLFRDEWGEDAYQNVLKILKDRRTRRDFPEWSIRLWEDRSALSDAKYWELPNQALRLMSQQDLDDDRVPEQFRAGVEALLAAESEEDREALIAADPDLDRDWRAELRQADPEMDARLALWGYGGKLQSKEAYDLVVQWGKELGIPLEAMGLTIPPRQHLDAYFGLNQVVAQTSGSSAEARLFKLENPEYLAWGIEQGVWSDDLSTENLNALRLQVEWRETSDEYGALTEREARREFKQAHRDWADDMRRVEASEKEVPAPAIEGYVTYYAVLDTGKPEGWDRWWQDDRALRDSPAFYAYALETLGWQSRDFSKIPSEVFEKAYNETYINLRKPDGSADRAARAAFRREDPDFDAEGAKAGLWKAME